MHPTTERTAAAAAATLAQISRSNPDGIAVSAPRTECIIISTRTERERESAVMGVLGGGGASALSLSFSACLCRPYARCTPSPDCWIASFPSCLLFLSRALFPVVSSSPPPPLSVEPPCCSLPYGERECALSFPLPRLFIFLFLSHLALPRPRFLSVAIYPYLDVGMTVTEEFYRSRPVVARCSLKHLVSAPGYGSPAHISRVVVALPLFRFLSLIFRVAFPHGVIIGARVAATRVERNDEALSMLLHFVC